VVAVAWEAAAVSLDPPVGDWDVEEEAAAGSMRRRPATLVSAREEFARLAWRPWCRRQLCDYDFFFLRCLLEITPNGLDGPNLHHPISAIGLFYTCPSKMAVEGTIKQA
jgi:hypothetical protein